MVGLCCPKNVVPRVPWRHLRFVLARVHVVLFCFLRFYEVIRTGLWLGDYWRHHLSSVFFSCGVIFFGVWEGVGRVARAVLSIFGASNFWIDSVLIRFVLVRSLACLDSVGLRNSARFFCSFFFAFAFCGGWCGKKWWGVLCVGCRVFFSFLFFTFFFFAARLLLYRACRSPHILPYAMTAIYVSVSSTYYLV